MPLPEYIPAIPRPIEPREPDHPTTCYCGGTIYAENAADEAFFGRCIVCDAEVCEVHGEETWTPTPETFRKLIERLAEDDVWPHVEDLDEVADGLRATIALARDKAEAVAKARRAVTS